MASYETLVLTGGGLKCIAYFGFLASLERPRRVVGISAGALVGLMYVLGTDTAAFLDIAYRYARCAVSDMDILGLVDAFGLSDISVVMRDALEEAVRAWWWKLAVANPHRHGQPPPRTFEELSKWSGYDFVVCATDAATLEQAYFSLDETPGASFVDAVMASCAIPLVFRPVAVMGGRYIDAAVSESAPLAFLRREKTSPRTALVLVCSSEPPPPPPPAAAGASDDGARETVLGYSVRLVAKLMDKATAVNVAELRRFARVYTVRVRCAPLAQMLVRGVPPAAVNDLHLVGMRQGKLFAQSNKHEVAGPGPRMRGADNGDGRGVQDQDTRAGEARRP